MNGLNWPVPNLVLIACLAIGVVAQIWVAGRTARSATRWWLVSLLNVAFVLCLWLFLQPPERPLVSQTVTLLTPGATADDVRRARRARTPAAIGSIANGDNAANRVTTYPDLASLRLAHPYATTLEVLGAGLSEPYWQADASWQVQFSPPTPRAGLRYVNWPRRIDGGQTLVVSGQTQGGFAGSVQLLDPAGDTTERVAADAEGRFSLNTTPRSPGRFIYRIELLDGERVVASNPLPVHIVEPAPVDLLMVLSSPSFESRYLKNWAARGGARLAIRTTLSKDRFRDEFVARDTVPLNRLERSVLTGFDVVVIDQRAWLALDASERRAVFDGVSQDGLGLIMMAANARTAPDDAQGFPRLIETPARQRALVVDGTTSAATTVTLAAARFADDVSANTVALRDVSGQAVVASRPAGKGRVGITLVTDSHKLVTVGNVQQHARYWQTLIEHMTPPDVQAGVEWSPALPLVQHRVQICQFGEPLANEAVFDDTTRIALQQQPYRPGEHCGYWWPDRAGWHSARLGNIEREVYVFGHNDWVDVRQTAATAATTLAAQREVTAPSPAARRNTPVPRWWFALPLLLICAALWLEQKLSDG